MKIEINIDDNNLLTLRELTRKVKKQVETIKYKKNNFRIPKSKNPQELTLDECYELIKKSRVKKKKKK